MKSLLLVVIYLVLFFNITSAQNYNQTNRTIIKDAQGNLLGYAERDYYDNSKLNVYDANGKLINVIEYSNDFYNKARSVFPNTAKLEYKDDPLAKEIMPNYQNLSNSAWGVNEQTNSNSPDVKISKSNNRKTSPNSTSSEISPGISKEDEVRYRQVIIELTKAINLNPKDDKNYYNRGLAKYLIQDYRGAIEDCNKSLDINKKNFNAILTRGNCKEMINDNKGAISDFSQAIKINPNDASPYYNRGRIFLMQGKKDKACLDFSKAGELGVESSYEIIREYCN